MVPVKRQPELAGEAALGEVDGALGAVHDDDAGGRDVAADRDVDRLGDAAAGAVDRGVLDAADAAAVVGGLAGCRRRRRGARRRACGRGSGDL